MKFDLYWTASALETIAKGGEPYYFQLLVAQHGRKPEGNYVFAGTAEVSAPTAEAAAPIAVAELRKQQAELRVAAETDCAALEDRSKNMLAITYTPVKESTNES